MTPNFVKIWVSYVSTCMQILVEIPIILTCFRSLDWGAYLLFVAILGVISSIIFSRWGSGGLKG